MNGQAGKGDQYRPVNLERYYSEWDRIFGSKKKKSSPKKKACKKK